LSKNDAIELSHLQPPYLGVTRRSSMEVQAACHERLAWAAALPPALLEGEDDALVDVCRFPGWRWGLGGLLHGHGCVRAQAEPAIGQQGDRLNPGTREEHGRWWAERSVTPKSRGGPGLTR